MRNVLVMASKKELVQQLDDILTQFVEEEEQTIDQVFKGVAEDTRRFVESKSPKDSGDYAKGWEVVQGSANSLIGDGVVDYVVANTEHYQLTHLLEKGHAIENKYGMYGRTRAKRHIKPAEKYGTQELIERLRKKL